MFNKFLILALFLSAKPLLAAEQVYSCDATHKSRWGYVAPQVIFFLDDQNGTVRVLDGIIQTIMADRWRRHIADGRTPSEPCSGS